MSTETLSRDGMVKTLEPYQTNALEEIIKHGTRKQLLAPKQIVEQTERLPREFEKPKPQVPKLTTAQRLQFWKTFTTPVDPNAPQIPTERTVTAWEPIKPYLEGYTAVGQGLLAPLQTKVNEYLESTGSEKKGLIKAINAVKLPRTPQEEIEYYLELVREKFKLHSLILQHEQLGLGTAAAKLDRFATKILSVLNPKAAVEEEVEEE